MRINRRTAHRCRRFWLSVEIKVQLTFLGEQSVADEARTRGSRFATPVETRIVRRCRKLHVAFVCTRGFSRYAHTNIGCVYTFFLSLFLFSLRFSFPSHNTPLQKNTRLFLAVCRPRNETPRLSRLEIRNSCTWLVSFALKGFLTRPGIQRGTVRTLIAPPRRPALNEALIRPLPRYRAIVFSLPSERRDFH